MSSTNRSNVRRANDFYETPDWVTDAILPHLGKSASVLDPCAGKGAILRRVFRHNPRVALFGLEIDPSRAALSPDTEVRDALDGCRWPRAELIITNPPFSLAQEFVERALITMARRGALGQVAMLLRLSFLESKGRAKFHQDFPADVYVLAKRPSFTGDGKADSCAYAWFVWRTPASGEPGRVRVLG